MPSLDDRMIGLEKRMDDVEARGEHSASVAVNANDMALSAQKAHQQNIKLLNAIQSTQANQSKTLAEHSRILDRHTQTLAEHSRRLDAIEHRLDAIEEKLGVLLVGMHSIESMLSRLVADDDTSPNAGSAGE